ncbi:AraC family transcriptional regulator [Enterobacter sp. R4-368]|uniref:AraC family transcriptional regulator n=1 Tax=Enterobacter sp. R4-368 TaxID=1166130 RepID=UPI00034EE71A|nr:AraC family transcriptional regulator [Enterobacter sp. R4-368]AGN85500.1 hypothetical protein H650_10100 [Enterobacter sp. R4-368]
MDSLSQLLAMLAPLCAVNLHCRFAGRWEADHQQLAPGVVPWHVVLHGEARLMVEGRNVDVCAGDVLLLPHGSPHLLQSLVEWGQIVPALKHDNGILTEVRSPAKGAAVEVLCGEFDFGPHSGWLFAHESRLIHLQTNHWQACPELEMLLMMLVRESLGSLPGNATIAKGLADTLLALILRLLLALHEPPAGLLRLMSNKRLAPALLAVIADPAHPWTLETMAERCFLSRATFARYFARSYPLTPQAWLSQLRMAMASQLLITHAGLTIDAIAERCGFLSLSSFSKGFKRLYGVSPAQYRKRRTHLLTPQP